MKRKFYIPVLILVFGLTSLSYGQDPTFSQFYNNQTYFNPAYVGLYQGLRAKFHYRRQWTQVPGAFNTYGFAVDFAERNLPGAGGIGLIVNSARSGMGYTQETMVGLQPSVRIHLESNMLIQVGFTAAFAQRRIDWNNLVFPDQLDPIQGNIYTSKFVAPTDDRVTYPDFSAGAIFQFTGNLDRLIGNIGGAVHHLTKPNISFTGKSAPLPRRYVVHFDLVFDLTNNRGLYRKSVDFKLNPGIFYQNQGKMNDYAIGMNIYFTRVYLGAWYKNESLEYDVYSHFSLMGGLNIPIQNETSRVKFMYSYDMVINAEHTFTGPTHEISVIIEFDEFTLIRGQQIGGIHRRADRLECSPF